MTLRIILRPRGDGKTTALAEIVAKGAADILIAPTVAQADIAFRAARAVNPQVLHRQFMSITGFRRGVHGSGVRIVVDEADAVLCMLLGVHSDVTIALTDGEVL